MPRRASSAARTAAWAAKESRTPRTIDRGLNFTSPLAVACEITSESASSVCASSRESRFADATAAPSAPRIGGGYQPRRPISSPAAAAMRAVTSHPIAMAVINREREDRGDGLRMGVDGEAVDGVLVVERVRHRTVGEGRGSRRYAMRGSEHGRIRPAALGDRQLGELCGAGVLPGGRQRHSDRVKQRLFGRADRVGRQIIDPQASGDADEVLRKTVHVLLHQIHNRYHF